MDGYITILQPMGTSKNLTFFFFPVESPGTAKHIVSGMLVGFAGGVNTDSFSLLSTKIDHVFNLFDFYGGPTSRCWSKHGW